MKHWHSGAVEPGHYILCPIKEMFLNLDADRGGSRKKMKESRGSSRSGTDVDEDVLRSEREIPRGFKHGIERAREVWSGALWQLAFVSGQEIEGRVVTEQYAVPPIITLGLGNGVEGDTQVVRTSEIASEEVSYVARGVPKSVLHLLTLLFDRKIATKFEALFAACFELAAGGAAHFVDVAGIGADFAAKMHATSIGPGGESVETKMAGLDLLGDVRSLDAAPVHEVFWWYQNASVVPGATARAALQAVEGRGFVHVSAP